MDTVLRLICLLILAVCLPHDTAEAFSLTKIGKARDAYEESKNLGDKGMIIQALAKLEEAERYLAEILAGNPNDPEANEVFGYCRFTMNNYKDALPAFKIAAKDPKLQDNIIKKIQARANYYRNNKRHHDAVKMHLFMAEVAPHLDIASRLNSIGKHYLDKGEWDLARHYYDNAMRQDNGIRDEIARDWINASRKLEDPFGKMLLYRRALQYSSCCDQEIISAIIDAARKAERKKIEREINLFPENIKKAVISTVWPPDYKECLTGHVEIIDLTGEKTESMWIRPKANRVEFQRDIRFPGLIVIVTRSGKEYLPKDNATILEDFKIVRKNGETRAKLSFK